VTTEYVTVENVPKSPFGGLISERAYFFIPLLAQKNLAKSEAFFAIYGLLIII